MATFPNKALYLAPEWPHCQSSNEFLSSSFFFAGGDWTSTTTLLMSQIDIFYAFALPFVLNSLTNKYISKSV